MRSQEKNGKKFNPAWWTRLVPHSYQPTRSQNGCPLSLCPDPRRPAPPVPLFLALKGKPETGTPVPPIQYVAHGDFSIFQSDERTEPA